MSDWEKPLEHEAGVDWDRSVIQLPWESGDEDDECDILSLHSE
jgi:hypothetical protein